MCKMLCALQGPLPLDIYLFIYECREATDDFELLSFLQWYHMPDYLTDDGLSGCSTCDRQSQALLKIQAGIGTVSRMLRKPSQKGTAVLA